MKYFTKTNRIIFFSFSLILYSACLPFKKIDEHASTLMSREEVNQALKIHLETNEIVNWDSISNELMYNMAMHSDSMVSIGYTPISGDKSMYAYQFDILPEEWVDKRDELIQLVLKEERRYQNIPTLETKYIVLHTPLNDKLDKRPGITFKITSPLIIPKLRKNLFVRYVHVYYPVESVLFMEDY